MEAAELGTSHAQQGQGFAQALEGRGNHAIREHDDAQAIAAGSGRGEKNYLGVVMRGFRALWGWACNMRR